MDNWDEVRTAYQVARKGTVSGAAEVLGVHHATVIRHIDSLESRLGVKLFQRHARGYTATEAGQDLLTVAQTTDDQFTQLAGRIRGRGEGVSGELVVTSLATLSALLAPVLVDFQRENEGLQVRYLTGSRLFRLEYGEAHVALRAGAAPEQPDNVVQPFLSQAIRMVASRDYIARRGKPESVEDLKQHDFVGLDPLDSRVPFMRWLLAQVPRERVVFRTMENQSVVDAIAAGAGIGFLCEWDIDRERMVEVLPAMEEWQSRLWIVTHVDLHRTPKVQAFLKFLKERAKGWTFA
ncbi:transcriptional regulator, LysR family protein [Oceanicola granulosus HTCC2516]|uniref:Transcriptional regulator, LysR family protein n=1 Tax=Oceanicola granulosus (strain ATCC BAA-861 / DSM 15982 / KCTC 12143 / HTCC2516) TaxID=314256 RepID=Q2CDP7_OCEGH|nr:LysR family transcriptional regulator [Oceanicola granulosus]EAR50803.1 transcriptional regulator, LysR family protein [Oceanicola granulosus HTCC2516]